MSTTQDYQAAEQLLRRPARPGELVIGDRIRPQFDGGTRFWYAVSNGAGRRFVLVDPAAGTREPAFDHARLAAALAAASGRQVDPEALPFMAIELAGNTVELDAFGGHWRCRLDSYVCEQAEFTPPANPLEVPSPDKKVAVSRRGYDLWARSLADGREWALTTDGEPDYQYGSGPDSTSNGTLLRKFGMPHLPPAVAWSPDSTKVLAHRTDERGVRQTHLVEARPADGGAPLLRTQRYAYAGDEQMPLAELVVLDVQAGTMVRAQADPLLMPQSSPIMSNWAWWAEDGSAVYYLSQPRDLRTLTLHRLEPATGEVTTVLSETGATRVEPNQWMNEPPIVRVLADEVLWYSQRDGWGHLYRYDLRTGALGGQVTSGQWAVRQILHVDEAERVVYFTASGLVEEDPYRRTVCRVGLDGSGFAKVTDDELDHIVTLPDNQEYFIDSASTVDTPPVSRVRDWAGRVLVELERADITKLTATGWTPPERFHVKAADGVTDLYGVLYRPRGFDPAQRYPVVDSVYPGPNVTRVAPSFDPGGMGLDAEPVAALGFVVVAVDGRAPQGGASPSTTPPTATWPTRAAWPTMSRRCGSWPRPGRGWTWTGWARSATPEAGSPQCGRCWSSPRCTRPASPSPARTTPATSTRALWRPTTVRTTPKPGPAPPTSTSRTGWPASCCSSTAAWTTRCTRTTRCGWPSGSSPPTRTSSCSSCPGPSTPTSTAWPMSASAAGTSWCAS
jgi:dipeptidyl-peptidase-4